MNAKNAVIGIGILALIVFVSFTVLFFFKLNTTVSDFSMSDVTNLSQFYYNIFHGRPLQVTTYLEESSQFHNPYPYFNTMVIHGFLLSGLIVSLFYIPWPGINTMYAVFIMFNFIGFAFFTFKIMQRLSPSDVYLKALLAFSVYLLSGILRQTVARGLAITMCGPFILAAYYFLISDKKYALFFTIASLCLIQEDLAIFAITFLIVLLFFEKKCKIAIYWSLAFSIGYFILWNFIIQPASRYDLVIVNRGSSSMLQERFHQILESLFSWKLYLKRSFVVFSGFYLPALAAIIIYRFFGVLRRQPWLKIFSFAFLAAAAHWAYGAFHSLGTYLMPPLTMVYLAFLLFLCGINFDWKKKITQRASVILLAAVGIFLVVNLIVMAPVLPYSLRSNMWKIVKQRTGVEIFQRNDVERQIVSNKETIKVVKAIPADKSVVFWGNQSICAFMSCRNDFWFFPMYYDLADFLVIQKGAEHSWFSAGDLKDLYYNRPGFWGRLYGHSTDEAVSGHLVDRIREDLVGNRGTHRVMCDTKYALVLERAIRYKFYMPESSMGLGWIAHYTGKRE